MKEATEDDAVVANIHYGGEYQVWLEAAAASGECPLCKQVSENPAIVLDKTLWWYVRQNPYPPQAGEPPHSADDPRPHAAQSFLIIPFQHVTAIRYLVSRDWLEVAELFNRLCTREGIGGGGLCLRFGDPVSSGRTILHLHFHVIQPPLHPSPPPERPNSVLPVWFPIG